MTAAADPGTVAVHRRVEMIMGMPISLAVRRTDGVRAGLDAAWAEVVADLREIDRIFSTYRNDSIISRLGRGEIVLDQCPPEVGEVFGIGAEANRRSGGSFSIMLPTDDGPRLDPTGVVKGWAVERVSQLLTELDDVDFCLSAGGDMVCHTATEQSPPWRIGIEDPRDPTKIIAVVPVSCGAVATSGASRRGEHIVDARTGRPPTGIASVTVIADSLTRADVDATAAYALGCDAVDWLARQSGLLALVVEPDGHCITVDNRTGTPKIIGRP
ncbi:FAD:protein FMN transferase [Microlunatus endophyticus]|uniref:FAD:protein FMN transferase n=1 Tax=Microlunatus endophyticus TaxID=1716077 RepID=A0A917S3Y3_9ACTN|nr:FAD:protein FMN transferase [Microlunatus endophyticus]GGL56380.1 FAD:protein FMN transferase [Microlunatus endophyticus]